MDVIMFALHKILKFCKFFVGYCSTSQCYVTCPCLDRQISADKQGSNPPHEEFPHHHQNLVRLTEERLLELAVPSSVASNARARAGRQSTVTNWLGDKQAASTRSQDL